MIILLFVAYGHDQPVSPHLGAIWFYNMWYDNEGDLMGDRLDC